MCVSFTYGEVYDAGWVCSNNDKKKVYLYFGISHLNLLSDQGIIKTSTLQESRTENEAVPPKYDALTCMLRVGSCAAEVGPSVGAGRSVEVDGEQ